MRAPIALLAATIGVVILGAAAAATVPSVQSASALPRVAGGGSAGVVRTSLICPDLLIKPGTLGTTIAVGTGHPGPGSVRLSPASGNDAGPTAPVLGAGQRVARYSGPLTGPIRLDAQGSLAGSLVAEQIARANKTADRGWAEARCEPPRADQWFVGAATRPGDTPEIVLANPTDKTAIYDITVLTANGLSTPSIGNNLTLQPHGVVTTKLSTLAPNAAVTAVEVHTTTGRVSAAVRDIRTSGETLLGTDWVPVSTPAAQLTIAGFPASTIGKVPGRGVFIGVPGATDATVRVQVTTSAGTFVPVGLDAVSIAAGTVRTIDIGRVLGKRAGAVTVTSDDPEVPIVASGLIDAPSSKGTAIHEIAFLGPATALRGAALVPINYTAGDVDSHLILSAPKGAVTATMLVTSPAGASKQVPLAVPAGTTVEVSLRALKVPNQSSVTVLPSAGSGPLYAARLTIENGLLGPLLSAFTLVGAPPSQQVPNVVQLPVAGP